jgi:hypothetical protein
MLESLWGFGLKPTTAIVLAFFRIFLISESSVRILPDFTFRSRLVVFFDPCYEAPVIVRFPLSGTALIK